MHTPKPTPGGPESHTAPRLGPAPPACLGLLTALLASPAPTQVNTFISGAPCNCAAFVAGIVRGVLDAAQFPARVSAHEHEGRTVILIKFDPEVLEREKRQT